MREADIRLAGLERLVQVCRERGFPARLEPSTTRAPAAGEPVLGGPLDPELAAFHARFARATLADLMVYRLGAELDGMLRVNELVRRRGQEPFRSCVLFGQVPSLAYYYAVVPSLADTRGIQPVLYVDNHDDRCVLPVASSVDHLFDTYARFLEALEGQPGHAPGEYASATFPFAVPDIVGEDRALVELLEAGRFDGLVSTDPGSQDWAQQVLQARPRGGPRR